MLSGPNKTNLLRLILACFLIAGLYSCKDDKNTYTSFKTPEAGGRIASGSSFSATLDISDVPDSIVYFIDSTRVGNKKDTTAVSINTTGIAMGNHVLMARIYRSAGPEEATTNITIVAASAPKEYRYKVVNTYPHDIEAYTEGLEFHDGYMYESTGQEGSSVLKRYELSTGKVLQKVALEDPQQFGEGMTVIGNKIIYLTWKHAVGYVYDKATFKRTGEFAYPGREGWGLAFDGKRVLNTSGSNTIYFLDKDTYQTTGSIEVYDNNGAVSQLNEIEYVDGKIYANVYLVDGFYANKILIIDPATGVVEATINMVGLHPEKSQTGNLDYVMNGIAYDKAGKRLFVTGKKWSKLFEVSVVKD